ncbi:helicase-related protein [Fredinandcohnia onubensis]|uniref:helicase-related protein n=1 Tax=Fredinandcohnia onubensis TaxID=1571209 RepID=UPI000C0BF415|nr:helicase-related protein [Fredinandcohnia onubensis]
MINLEQKEKEILSGLKDFQRATVERIHYLFTNHYSRVLVADEVGLGKTLIAKGVIAKTARYHREIVEDPLFKVVYVCSNQGIASQNLKKLMIDQNVQVEKASNNRLSMQHLRIFEDKYDEELKEKYIQLIPLTPMTSFEMTTGFGSANERALMFAFLKRHNELHEHIEELDWFMMDKAKSSWNWLKNYFEDRVLTVDEISHGEYIETILSQIELAFGNNPTINHELQEVCRLIKEHNFPDARVKGSKKVILFLRKMMAEISVKMMEPDLVIMDEFQRFSELINTESESETAILAKKFFNSGNSSNEEVKTLLLSATPYKMYSTLEEIQESGSDDHYKEFFQVTNFLFEKKPDQQQRFETVWKDYSTALSEFTHHDLVILRAKKQEAEEQLYKGIARTERMLAEGASELIKGRVEKLEVSHEDVRSYINLDQLLQEAELNDKLPVEYVKSAPYLMSFMDKYKLKQKISQYFNHHPDKVPLANKEGLWVERKSIDNYKQIPDVNARLSKLKEIALPQGAERLLWVPPSRPYYEFGGSYTGHQQFSKVLVFSAWEMVPRSIATLLSYEAERLTVGEMIKKIPNKKKRKSKKNYLYSAERRFPQPRIRFVMKDNAPSNMNHLTLLYPSISLAKLFDPVDVLNRKVTLAEIKVEITEKIREMLNEIPEEESARIDERWYFMAPLLFDIKEPVMKDWFSAERFMEVDDQGDTKDGDDKALTLHFKELREIFLSEEYPNLGKKPDDLVEVLVSMALGSPSVCGIRMLDQVDSTSLTDIVMFGKSVLNRFNSQEAIAIVDLEYSTKDREHTHWKNVLRYCVDGNFQAMIDEYAHMLLEEGGLKHKDTTERNQELIEAIKESLEFRSAPLQVDTFSSFKRRVTTGTAPSGLRMRTSYAVGFADKRNEDRAHDRKQSVRRSFNSPFRPFVLASTSIGQEGLDFHYYCRKIVHWNLPSNPIDLEQREGRINRYKSFAIRQNIARKYGDLEFEKDIWEEMFDQANKSERNENTSELVPYWTLSENQGIQIERIVPIYPFSKDGHKYQRLMKILQLYRLSLGQAKQEELLEYIFQHDVDEAELKEMFMNLSPYYRG